MNFFVRVIFPLMFCLVFGIILFTYVSNIKRWNKNNRSPRLTVRTKVVAKRYEVRGRYDSNSFNSYFVTFEFESGDRLELSLNGVDFGMLAEGDSGNLTFQGTRYIDFERI